MGLTYIRPGGIYFAIIMTNTITSSKGEDMKFYSQNTTIQELLSMVESELKASGIRNPAKLDKLTPLLVSDILEKFDVRRRKLHV